MNGRFGEHFGFAHRRRNSGCSVVRNLEHRRRCFDDLLVAHGHTSRSSVALGSPGRVRTSQNSVGAADTHRCWPYPQRNLDVMILVGWRSRDHHPPIVFRSCRCGSSKGGNTRYHSSSHRSTGHSPSPGHTQARHHCRAILGPLRVRGDPFLAGVRVDVSLYWGWVPLKLNPKTTKGYRAQGRVKAECVIKRDFSEKVSTDGK